MIVYGILQIILYVLNLLASIFGSLIPDLPTALSGLLQTLLTTFSGGVTFVSYFFYWEAVVALISLIIAYHSFEMVKYAVMKVIGHFIAD